MPTISRFFGIVIRMYHRERAPPHLKAAEAHRRLKPIRPLE